MIYNAELSNLHDRINRLEKQSGGAQSSYSVQELCKITRELLRMVEQLSVRKEIALMKPKMKQSDSATYRLWPEAGRKIGLGRSSTYAAAERGEIPVIEIGGLKLVPKAILHKMLGLEE